MKRFQFFIDGFNVYHSIATRPGYVKYKWINYRKLAQCFVSSKNSIEDVYYFTALALWNPEKVERHKIYIKALRNEGVKIIHGEFKKRDMLCLKCDKIYQTFEEKMTDVNMAIHLFEGAINDSYDTAVIITGDSDLIPSVEAVKRLFPEKEIGIVIPIGRKAESLKNTADFYMKMKQKHLSTCQLDDEITLPDGQIITRPESWR